MSSICVLVVEDSELFRRFITATLKERPDLQFICEVSDGLEAVQKAKELQPDLIVLDIGLPRLNESKPLGESALWGLAIAIFDPSIKGREL